MNFLGDIGIDLWLLVAQIVNFLFLLWILSKFVYKPLIARIEKDEKIIQEVSYVQATLTEKEADIARKEKQYTTRTKNKAKAIITEAQEIADIIKDTARIETKHEKEAIIAQVQKRLAEVTHDNN